MKRFIFVAPVLVSSVLGASLLAPTFAAPAPGKSASSKSVAPSKSKSTTKKKTAAQLKEEKIVALLRASDKAFHAGDYPRTIALHRQVVALDPTEVESYSTVAWLLWSMGKGKEALQFLKQGANANPKSAAMWEAVGDHYGTFLKRHREGQAAYTRALQLSPRGSDTQILRRRLAHAAEKAGDLTTSRATWRALVRDFPNDVVLRNNLARVEKRAR